MVIAEQILEKYYKMKSLGIDEDFYDLEHFGEIKIFINKKPKIVLFSINIDNDIVYFGTN